MDESQAMVVSPRRIEWGEFMSVIIQTHYSLGYVDIAEKLNSNIAAAHQPLKFAKLRTQFLGGFWERCAQTLCRIIGLTQEDVSAAMFVILSMWLIERLALDRRYDDSNVLDNSYFTRLSLADRRRVARIKREIYTLEDGFESLLRICTLSALNDFHVALEVRKDVLKKLELTLPSVGPTLDTRLLSVIDYGVSAQIYSCLSHNRKDVMPLYCDHSCRTDQLPTKTLQILNGHHKKIWTLKFSHNGLYLASGSDDCTAIIWEVPDGWVFKKKHVLPGHTEAIFYVSWSPNDESLLTCAPLEHIKMWDVCTGECKRVISEDDHVLRSCDFLMSDQIEIVYGTSLRRQSIRLLRKGHDEDLVLLPRQDGHSTFEFAVTPNGSKVIYYNRYDSKFTIKHIDTGRSESFMAGHSILGISVSEDSASLILNLSNNEIQVWDFNRLIDRPLTYWNFKQIIDEDFRCIGGVESCIGGVESSFLVSGTQDSKVCIWNRRQARPLAVLSGHESAVRCVSWNPERPQMLASASDDGNIRIWGPQSQEVPQLLRHD